VSAPDTRGTVEVACDESGFVGGSLFGGARVFAHASVHIETDDAVALVEEVRRRTGAGTQELKASRLNRPWAHPVATWLCSPDGPLRGRAVVPLTATRTFGLARLAQVLRADRAPEGWWSPREEPASWEQALRLDEVLGELPARWEHEVLVAGRNLLWIRRRRRHGEPVETWVDVVRAAAERLPDPEARRVLRGWASPEAVQRAHDHLAAPPASPLSEPLLPALRWTVHHWSAQGDVSVVHEAQSVLTPARVAASAAELESSRPGRRLVGFVRVDSRDDARVQLADLLAGVVRRGAEDAFAGARAEPPIPVDHLVTGDASALSADEAGDRPSHRSSRKNVSQPSIASGTS
jgi:hypothetical protein